uniref:Uncharacterized protein n=1 Tax=Rhizophora mucronata TaxID=61149 RepID=A0A2P2QW61_RHIMU
MFDPNSRTGNTTPQQQQQHPNNRNCKTKLKTQTGNPNPNQAKMFLMVSHLYRHGKRVHPFYSTLLLLTINI